MQNPTISLARDVSATKLIIGSLPSPVILVGRCHHRGGDSPERRWIGGYHFLRPDNGESVNSLIANPPPGAPVPPILPPKGGYLFLDKTKFAASFAGNVDPETAAFMTDSQVPWGVDALAGAITLGSPNLVGISKFATTR